MRLYPLPVVYAFILNSSSVVPAAGAPGPVGAVGPFSPHQPIVIASDADLVVGTNGIVSGSGSEVDPFIIEGWRIDISNPDQDMDGIPDFDAGILVNSATKHLLIRNVLIEGAGEPSSASGISLPRPFNTKVTRVTVRLANVGIGGRLTVADVMSNEISDSLLSENRTGISGAFRRISRNVVEASLELGMTPDGDDLVLTENTVAHNAGGGILLGSSRRMRVENNEVADNGGTGIHIGANESNDILVNNVVRRNAGFGILLSAAGVSVEGNFIAQNRTGGVKLRTFQGAHVLVRNNRLVDNVIDMDLDGDGRSDTVGISFAADAPFPLSLAGENCNTVSGTNWVNGMPSFEITAGQNIVDAGADKTGARGVAITFDDAVLQTHCAKISSVHWDWGDGSIGTSSLIDTNMATVTPDTGVALAAVEHTYSTSGVYHPTVTTVLENGMRLMDRLEVTIGP